MQKIRIIFSEVSRLAGLLLVTFVTFGIFLFIIGKHPISVFRDMFIGSFGTSFSFQDTLIRATPLMLTALCTLVPAHLGIMVIGNEGALLMGGLGSALFASWFPVLPGPLGIMVTMLGGAVFGGVWILLVGLAREYRGMNATITSLLLFYIGRGIYNFLVSGPLRDPATLNKPGTYRIPDNYVISTIGNSNVHWGLAVAVIFCLIMFYVLFYTRWGFSVRVAGGSAKAANLVGLAGTRLVLSACFIGGAAAGLAGALEVMAIHGNANLALYAGYGFGGILIAFAAKQNPLAVIPVSMILGGIQASSGLVQRRHGLPDATIDMFEGLLFIVILCAGLFPVIKASGIKSLMSAGTRPEGERV